MDVRALPRRRAEDVNRPFSAARERQYGAHYDKANDDELHSIRCSGGGSGILGQVMTLDLTDDETAALAKLFGRTNDNDRHPLSPRLVPSQNAAGNHGTGIRQ
jgi:hypothetical protein